MQNGQASQTHGEIGMKCPKCAEFSPEDQGEIVMKKTRKGREPLRLFPIPQMRLRLLEKSDGKNPNKANAWFELRNSVFEEHYGARRRE